MPGNPPNFCESDRSIASASPWIVTVATLVLAMMIRTLRGPFDELPLIPLFLAVVVAAYVGGLSTGLSATVAAVILDRAFPAEIPQWAPYMQRIVAFVIACCIVTLISARLHRARSNAEAALRAFRESESRFKTFMCNLSAAAWTVDLDGKYTFMNEVGLRTLGKTQDEIMGRPYREVLSPEMASVCDRNDRKAVEMGSVVVSEEMMDIAGRQFHLLVSKFPLLTAGQRTGIGGVAIDVTDRVRAEQALERSLQHLQLITDGLPVMVASLDAEGRILFANREFREWFNLDDLDLPETGTGQMGGLAQGPLHDLIEKAMRGERCRAELRLPGPDSERWGDCTLIPQLEGETGVREVLMLIFDITERLNLERQRAQILESERAARAESERANRVKDEFLATISHELRTPLNAILGWVTLVQRGLAADMDQAIAVIERNARAEALLIDDLLDMGRILVGKLRLQVESVDLLDIVRCSVGVVRPAAEARRIEVELRAVGLESRDRVKADPARLQQILWNLLSNAIKFTPEGGRVEVIVGAAPDQLEVQVQDNGKGIDPAFLPYVFDRFRQADGSTRRTSGGLGLGLAIAKYLVELHGGNIEAESPGLNRGATFRLRLPRTAAPSTTAKPVDVGGPKLRGTRVLVVDDDPDAVEIAQRFLQDCQADVRTAENADQAMAVFTEFDPDVVVSDIGMPADDGFDLIRRIQEEDHRRGGHTPVVAMTAYVRQSDRDRIRLAGFQAHVSKPIDPAELCRAVAETRESRQSSPVESHA